LNEQLSLDQFDAKLGPDFTTVEPLGP